MNIKATATKEEGEEIDRSNSRSHGALYESSFKKLGKKIDVLNALINPQIVYCTCHPPLISS